MRFVPINSSFKSIISPEHFIAYDEGRRTEKAFRDGPLNHVRASTIMMRQFDTMLKPYGLACGTSFNIMKTTIQELLRADSVTDSITASITECYCGSSLLFDHCCGPILARTPAKTPEALMRSRYSAYVLGDMDYIDRTFAPEVRNDFDRAEAERTAKDTEWLGLEVIRSREEGDRGMVEFSFCFRYNNQEFTQHEVSTFRRDAGHWLYVDSKIGSGIAQRHVDKIGRNDPCPCGSGKKYKKCCAA